MVNTKTVYMGKELRNPIIVGACELTSNMDKIKQIERAGAGAIVIKSLFEEQIQLESFKMEEELRKNDELHAEMITIFAGKCSPPSSRTPLTRSSPVISSVLAPSLKEKPISSIMP